MRKSEEMFYVPTRIVKNSARIRCINFKRLWLLLFLLLFFIYHRENRFSLFKFISVVLYTGT